MATNSSMDAYSFGTLWQEATQAVGYTWSALMSGLTDILGTRAYYNSEQSKYEEQRKITNFTTLANSGKNGNIVLIIGLLALVAIVVYIIYQKYKKDK